MSLAPTLLSAHDAGVSPILSISLSANPMMLAALKRSVRSILHRVKRRGLPNLLDIETSRRSRDFNGIVDLIRKAGTNSLAHFKNGYEHEGGLRLQQNPDEFAALVLALRTRRAIRQYFEIGSASGGSGRFLQDHVGFHHFTSMDDGNHPDAHYQETNLVTVPDFQQFLGDSHSQAAKEYMAKRYTTDRIDVAFIDGDHSVEGVKQDFELALPYCRSGAWVLLHDTVACDGVERTWLDAVASGMLKPVAEFIGRVAPLGIAIGEVP